MNQISLCFSKSPLFSGIRTDEISSMLSCLSARTQIYEKGELIYRCGERISAVGMVLRGCVHISKDDFWGNRTILSEVMPGQLFAETYACVHAEAIAVNVTAVENTEILFMDVKRILNVCSSACQFHTRLIRNLLSVMAQKNLLLTQKMDHMAQKTTREKLLSYLSAESLRYGSREFEIPFNRQELADYLCVDRSAMSSELGKMRDDGLLTFSKNKFYLK